jgi:hypothetical protein
MGVAEKLAMEVLKKDGAVINEGWLCWELPFEYPETGAATAAAASWHNISEASAQVPLPAEGGDGSEQPKPKSRKKAKGKAEFTSPYWKENGVDESSAHFQWCYGRFGGPMGWAAFESDLQEILQKAVCAGTTEFTHCDREK